MYVLPTNGGQPFDAWIRQNDGYPLKYSGDFSGPGTTTSAGNSGSLVVEFDKFNTGSKIAAPLPSEIKPEPKNVTGNVGQSMLLTGVTVTVVQSDLNRQRSNSYLLPKAGNRFVVAEVLYESTGTDKVSYNPYDWKLSDSSGYEYDQTYTGIGSELHSGELAPGGKVWGFIGYEVPKQASGFTLKAKVGDDSVMVTLS